MYQFDMTKEEVKRALAAARLVDKLSKSQQVSMGLEIGEQLLRGRAFAMHAAGTNKPQGRKYAEAFSEWKTTFKFPSGKDYNALYDHAIICAQHRSIAQEMLDGLSLQQRVEMGIFGLAKRVRARVNELEGRARETRKRRRPFHAEIEAVRGEMADMREELTAARAEAPQKHWRHDPEAVGAQMARLDGEAFRRLVAAGQKVLEE
jgi:hypothetical protein